MIYLFKTSIGTKRTFQIAKIILDKIIPDATWSIDLEDCDHVLRIDSETDITKLVTSVLNKLGFKCEELKDCSNVSNNMT